MKEFEGYDVFPKKGAQAILNIAYNGWVYMQWWIKSNKLQFTSELN